jgi:hypothetical protein
VPFSTHYVGRFKQWRSQSWRTRYLLDAQDREDFAPPFDSSACRKCATEVVLKTRLERLLGRKMHGIYKQEVVLGGSADMARSLPAKGLLRPLAIPP